LYIEHPAARNGLHPGYSRGTLAYQGYQHGSVLP